MLLAACASGGDSQGGPSPSDAAMTPRVDAIFADIRADAPGCAVGVYRNGDPVLAKGYGLANVEDARQMTAKRRSISAPRPKRCGHDEITRSGYPQMTRITQILKNSGILTESRDHREQRGAY